MKVREYIQANWNHSVHQPENTDRGIIRMTVPFSVPCINGCFSDFYYWDTYFANLGLLADGHVKQVENNLDTMAYFIEYLGYVPNSNHIIDRSQPPVFCRGVYDLYRATGDRKIAEKYIGAILNEYMFFRCDRMTPVGLNAYGTYTPRAMLLRHYPWLSKRIGESRETEEEKIRLSKNLLTIAESGWDFNPRFRTEQERYAADRFVHLDLNSLLYDMEVKTAELLDVLQRREDAQDFRDAAERRKELMREYLLDEKSGICFDYDYVGKKLSETLSCASVYPFAVGLADDASVLKEILARLELPHGISACEYRGEGEKYDQWDYPSMWPTNVFFTYLALCRTGLEEDAQRVAEKYLRTVESVFEETGSLWEKYDAWHGTVAKTREYETPQMMGWTAGIYRYLEEELKTEAKNCRTIA